MFASSLKVRVVLLTVTLVIASQAAIFGLMSLHQSNQVEVDARVALNAAERLVTTRVAQMREQGWLMAAQLLRDPVLNRTGATANQAPTIGTLAAQLKKSQANRLMIIENSGEIAHDLSIEGKSKAAIVPAFRVNMINGRSSGFVLAGDGLLLWVATALGGEGTPAVLLFYPLKEQLSADLVSVPGIQFKSGISSGLKPLEADSGFRVLSRRIFLTDAASNALAVELSLPIGKVTAVAIQNLDVPFFLVCLIGLVLSGAAGFTAMKIWLRPLNRLQLSVKSLLAGNFTPMPLSRRKDEVNLLAQTFNLLVEGVQQRERKILQTAYRDTLTSLPNRTLYQERLSEALQNAKQTSRPLTMLLVDLDQFKTVNETLGHSAGDAYLKEIAERIKSVLRGADSLIRVPGGKVNAPTPTIARLGGDDFAVLLPGCDIEQAQRVTARISDVVKQPFIHEGQTITLYATIGLATYPEHAQDAATLIRAVDMAMYEAKSKQLSSLVFDPKHESDREQYLALQIELRRALELNELRLVFQPKVSLRGEHRLMVEALLRWDHPERGPQNPATFIPFAEKTGFITTITRWVLDSAMRQANIWKQQGLDVQIAVNVSPKDVSGDALPTYIVSRMRHYGLPADQLTVEIAESAIVGEPESTRQCLTVLDRFGVKLSVDDFGTGFSSLSYLRELPVDGLKLDREFVQAVNKDNCSRVIVKSTVDLAHSLNVTITAEGVEDAETMATLRDLGCDYAQGYYFGKPLTADEYIDWVEHQLRRFADTPGQRTAVKRPPSPVSAM